MKKNRRDSRLLLEPLLVGNRTEITVCVVERKRSVEMFDFAAAPGLTLGKRVQVTVVVQEDVLNSLLWMLCIEPESHSQQA